MGIDQPETEPNRRSKLASAAFTAIGLVFFFGVGLAGGAAYKIYFSDDGGGPQIADKAGTPPAAPAAPPEQNSAVSAPSLAESPTEKTDAAPADSAALAAQAPQAAPTPAEATKPPMVAQDASPPPAASPPEATTQAASAEPQAIPSAETAPAQPSPEPAIQAAGPQPAPAMQEKPVVAAKAHRPAAVKNTAPPQTAAIHPPPAAQGTAGHFRVQFGAFANEENARRVQWAIEATGLKVAVSHDQGASGNPLFIVRSPSYPDRAAALSAAQAVQSRAKHLVNPVAIDYAIIPDRAAGEQHAQR